MGIVAGAGVFKEVERPHAVRRCWTSPDPICSTLMDMGRPTTAKSATAAQVAVSQLRIESEHGAQSAQ
jgi:hypothetical protein